MGLNNLSDWDRSGTLSPYQQSSGTQGINALSALLKIMQQQQQDAALRKAAGGMMGGTEVPQGVDAGKLFSDLAVEKNKPINATGILDQLELKETLKKLQGQTNVPQVLGDAVPIGDGSTMPSPNAPPLTDPLARPPQFIPGKTNKYGVPEDVENPDFTLFMKDKEGQIAEKNRGIDPVYKKQVEIFKDVLRHRGELEGLLFNQKQFKPGVKSWNPTRKENQRMQELLDEAQTAKKLLSARNVQGEDTSKMSIPGVGKGVSMFANPEAMQANLEDLYTTLGAATENIQPGATQGNSFATEQEALASGIKGEVIIGGRRARID